MAEGAQLTYEWAPVQTATDTGYKAGVPGRTSSAGLAVFSATLNGGSHRRIKAPQKKRFSNFFSQHSLMLPSNSGLGFEPALWRGLSASDQAGDALEDRMTERLSTVMSRLVYFCSRRFDRRNAKTVGWSNSTVRTGMAISID